MTLTPAGLSKKLDAALKKATPKELARIMADLYRPLWEKALDGEEPSDPKLEAQLVYIRDNFVRRLSTQDWIDYRNEAADLSDQDFMARLQLKDIRYLEGLILSDEVLVLILAEMEQALWEAGYQLGEDDSLEEDLETSPLKRHRERAQQVIERKEAHLRAMIQRRAELCLSSFWTDLGRPCPLSPEYSSWFTESRAQIGQPVPGSKERPLTLEEVRAAEKKRDKEREARAKKQAGPKKARTKVNRK